MSNYQIGRLSPMLNQTIGTVEADTQNSIRFITEQPTTNDFLFYRKGV